MTLKHGDKDLMDPGLLDDCQLAEWEDEETHQKNETNIVRKATFDEKVLTASLHFDNAMSEEDVGDKPNHQRKDSEKAPTSLNMILDLCTCYAQLASSEWF